MCMLFYFQAGNHVHRTDGKKIYIFCSSSNSLFRCCLKLSFIVLRPFARYNNANWTLPKEKNRREKKRECGVEIEEKKNLGKLGCTSKRTKATIDDGRSTISAILVFLLFTKKEKNIYLYRCKKKNTKEGKKRNSRLV